VPPHLTEHRIGNPVVTPTSVGIFGTSDGCTREPAPGRRLKADDSIVMYPVPVFSGRVKTGLELYEDPAASVIVSPGLAMLRAC
jgi:hypothetical protein